MLHTRALFQGNVVCDLALRLVIVAMKRRHEVLSYGEHNAEPLELRYAGQDAEKHVEPRAPEARANVVRHVVDLAGRVHHCRNDQQERPVGVLLARVHEGADDEELVPTEDAHQPRAVKRLTPGAKDMNRRVINQSAL